ncbi:MAG: amidase [Pseudomonadota bacterium]
MSDLAFLPAVELAAMIRQKKITSIELLEMYCQRIKRHNPALNAIVAMDEKAALQQARQADADLAGGKRMGPLHGVPITIKDTFEVVGLPCTSGAPKLKNHMPTRNAEAVQSLLNAGAVVMGKTNVPLYGGDIQSVNEVYGRTSNPWDESRTPGGSSGGAAAALAAGLTALELGSDIGGSIRIPAHFCGLYGHKPSYGIVPDQGHIPPLPGIFTGDYSLQIDIMVSGPLARSADDLDLAMTLITAPERADRTAWKIQLPEPRKKMLKEYRVGLWLDDPACPVDRHVGDAIQSAVDSLARAGAHVAEKKPAIDLTGSIDIFFNLLSAVMGGGATPGQFEKWRKMAADLPDTDQSYMAKHLRGATQLHNSWFMQDAMRQILRGKWAEFFKDFDVLLCPVSPVAAMKHDDRFFYDREIPINDTLRPYQDAMGWAGLVGVVGLPATVAPVGITPDGLPVGIQIVGPYLEDRTPIHFARLMKDVVGGFVPPPGYVNP